MTGLAVLIVTTVLESFGLGPEPMACDFPAKEADQDAMFVEVRARPSLKDQPGLYRALMDIEETNGPIQMRAAAQPLSSQVSRGFLVSGKAGGTVHYVIGVDAKGTAALSVTFVDQEPPLQMTRTGSCRNYGRYIRRWAPT